MNQPIYVDKHCYYQCDIGPDDQLWSEEEIAIEIWAKLGKARRAFRRSLNNDGTVNPWIEWIKPGPYLPECGFRVYTPGLIKRKEFAQFVVSVLGKHFRFSCWRSKRGGLTLFDTEDLGMEDDFFANLKVTVEKVTEVAVKVDGWTRAGTLKESFPNEWLGMTRRKATASLLAQALEAYSRKP